MIIPPEVRAACAAAARESTGDIARAKRVAKDRVRSLPGFQSFVNALVDDAIEGVVEEYRRIDNRARKRRAGLYGQPAKVRRFGTATVAAYESVYAYAIGGRQLGDLTGSDLLPLAQTERAVAGGHIVNAELLERLAQIVPANKTVRRSVSEDKIHAIFRQLGAEPLAQAGS